MPKFPPISTLADLPASENFFVGLCAGSSMWPSLKPGEQVLIVRIDPTIAAETLRVGDVLAFAAGDGRLTMHRLVNMVGDADGRALAITRGDNAALTERWPLEAAFVGKVVARVGKGKYNRIAAGPGVARRLWVRTRSALGRWRRRFLGRQPRS